VGFSGWRDRHAQPLWILMRLVALGLTIACVNVASLLLARSDPRSHNVFARFGDADLRRSYCQLLACAPGNECRPDDGAALRVTMSGLTPVAEILSEETPSLEAVTSHSASDR
jgi:hypothetical protein